MQVGDKVHYVPDKIHALNVNKDGTLAWEFTRPARRHEKGDTVVMTKEEITKAVKAAKRRKTAFPREQGKPRCTWPAVVDAIDGDKATVTIEGPACEFVYTVPIDPNKAPHTVHAEEQ